MIIRSVLAVSFAVLINGCAAPIPVDSKLVRLLPESAAKKILVARLGAEWTNDPYIEKSGSCVLDLHLDL